MQYIALSSSHGWRSILHSVILKFVTFDQVVVGRWRKDLSFYVLSTFQFFSDLCWWSGPYPGYKVWGEYVFRGQNFCFYLVFKKNFSGHNKLWGEQKHLVVTATECPSWLRTCWWL